MYNLIGKTFLNTQTEIIWQHHIIVFTNPKNQQVKQTWHFINILMDQVDRKSSLSIAIKLGSIYLTNTTSVSAAVYQGLYHNSGTGARCDEYAFKNHW